MRSLKGLLRLALAAVCLLVTAAAVEVRTEQEWLDALSAKSPEIVLMEAIDGLGEIDFDTVLDLGGLSQHILLTVKEGAAVTIKNGSIENTGAIDIYGSGVNGKPTVVRIESDVSIVTADGVRLYGPAGGCHLTVSGSIEAKKGACITIAESLSSGENEVLLSGAKLNNITGYVMECRGNASVTVENSAITGFAGILLQNGTLQVTGTNIMVTGVNKKNQNKPLDAITYDAQSAAVKLELGAENTISSANGYALNMQSGNGKVCVDGGQFTSGPEKEPIAMPDGLPKEALVIRNGRFSGETAALLPFLAADSTMNEEGTVAPLPEKEEPGTIIIEAIESETTEQQNNPVTGAAAPTVGLAAIAFVRFAARSAV